MTIDDARAGSAVRQVIIGRGPEALGRMRRAIDSGAAACLLRPGSAGRPQPEAPCPLLHTHGSPCSQGGTGIASIIDDHRAGEPLRLVVGDPVAALSERLLAEPSKIISTPSERRTGKLILIGGGPGPADLLTVRASRLLAVADLVLVDRLAPDDQLAELAPQALIVDVGKHPGHHPVPQASIESEAIAHAQAGATVVRLKGGDPFVFGRGGEELAAAKMAGIPVEVVPGVTSSVAVPGAAGIPITWRGLAHGFTVISGHAPLSEREYTHLVGLRTTLVMLMGLANLPHLTAGLLRHGMQPDTAAAVIERGFAPSQRSTFSTVSDLVFDAARIGVTGPAVIVIGDVVAAAAAMAAADGTDATWWDG